MLLTGAVKDVTAGREAHVIGLDAVPILAVTLQEVIAARAAAPAIIEAQAAHAITWGQAPIRVDTGPRVEHGRIDCSDVIGALPSKLTPLRRGFYLIATIFPARR
jgi:hypothetical protein